MFSSEKISDVFASFLCSYLNQSLVVNNKKKMWSMFSHFIFNELSFPFIIQYRFLVFLCLRSCSLKFSFLSLISVFLASIFQKMFEERQSKLFCRRRRRENVVVEIETSIFCHFSFSLKYSMSTCITAIFFEYLSRGDEV